MGKRIGIVGAGISGLLACKYVLSKGFIPIVFESRSTLGGVWSKTLEITKLQTATSIYRFSDFPWPSSHETYFPNHSEVLDYLQSYAKHFGLLKHIRFNTKVVSIQYNGPSEKEMQSWALWGGNGEPFGNNGTWTVTTEDLLGHSIEVTEVDFVILCLGRFSDVPNMPEFPAGKGPEEFDGKVIHSMEYTDMGHQSARNLIKGKRVTVVGFQKSALDIAMQCSTANGVENPCTIICRTPHWNLPDYFPLGASLANLYMSRFTELLVHKPGEGPLLAALTAFLSPLRWAISKFVENEIKKKHRLEKFGMVPDGSFLQELYTCVVSVIPQGFYDNVDKGSIVLKRSPTFHFYKHGVRVLDENENENDQDIVVAKQGSVKSDIVILATGFKGDQKLKNIFVSHKFQDYIMDSPNRTISLYRQCIHPRIPQLGVIGHSESANMYAFEMRCRWLVELLDGKFKLPSIEKMEKDTLEWEKFTKKYGGKYYTKSCVAGAHIWYNDQLCKDMGLNPKRKKGIWAEWFEPYGPIDYASTST